MQMIKGITSFSLNKPFGPDLHSDVVQGFVQRWQRQGYTVYAVLGANGGKLDMPDLALQPSQNAAWAWDVPELESLQIQKPTNVSHSYLPFGIYDIVSRTQATPPGWPFILDVGGLDYAYTVGGFYIQEADQPGEPFWRWTHDTALLRLPWAAPAGQGGRLTLRLRAGPVGRPMPAEVRVFLAGPNGERGVPLGEARVLPGAPFQDFAFPVPAQTGRAVLLRLESSTWSAYDAGTGTDRRALGVQLDSLRLEQAP
jgi:hypothetical protein